MASRRSSPKHRYVDVKVGPQRTLRRLVARHANVDIVCQIAQVYEKHDDPIVTPRPETVPPGAVLQLACPVAVTFAVCNRPWLESVNRPWQILPGTYSAIALSADLLDRQHNTDATGYCSFAGDLELKQLQHLVVGKHGFQTIEPKHRCGDVKVGPQRTLRRIFARHTNVDIVCQIVQVYEKHDDRTVTPRPETVPPGAVLQLACPMAVTFAVCNRPWLESINRLWQILPGTYSAIALSAVLLDRQHGRPESG